MYKGEVSLYVKNSRELEEQLKDWGLQRNAILVSYDVKTLYPSIPTDKALKLVEKLLSENVDLGEKRHDECNINNGIVEVDV